MSTMTVEWQADVLSPMLKWAGGKRWLVGRLAEMYAPFNGGRKARRFVDLFAGGLSVSLGLRPRVALVNDINQHVINFYRWLRIGFDGAPTFCMDSVPMRNERDVYLCNRTRFNELIDLRLGCSPEAAMLFWYLNRTGYNGLCRFNKGGHYNVPFGSYKRIDYSGMVGKFPHFQDALLGWRFVSRDFALVPTLPGDFIYADPPYDGAQTSFVGYAPAGFGWEDQVRLAGFLARHEGPVVTSNAATERIVALYEAKGFAVEFVDAPRRISCTGDRTPAREIVATKGL